MSKGPELETVRLVLRRWREEDLEPFAAMNAEPRVMEFFPEELGARSPMHSRTGRTPHSRGTATACGPSR